MAALIIEGAIGAGKTTLAAGLSEALGWPVYRPFRDGDSHTPGGTDPRLLALGYLFPVNSWQEDLYTAETLAKLRPNCIIDRGMPSGIAYAKTLSPEQARSIAGLWVDRVVAAEARVLYLSTPAQRRIEAARGRYWEGEAPRIVAAIAMMQDANPDFQPYIMRTGGLSAGKVLGSVLEWMLFPTPRQTDLIKEL